MSNDNKTFMIKAQQIKSWSIIKIAQYLHNLSKEGFNQGYEVACQDIPEGSVIITPDKTYVEFEYDEFCKVVATIKGVGKVRAEQIADVIIEYFDNKRQKKYEEK